MVAVLAEPRFDGEPDFRDETEGFWQEYNTYAWNLLLVLPAWEGYTDPLRPRWILARGRVPASAHDRLRAVIELPAEIVQIDSLAATNWQLPDGLPAPDLPAPQLLVLDAVDEEAGILEPIWSCDEGVLLASWHRHEGEVFYILSDPDLLNNGGLSRGENAHLVLALLESLGARDGGVLLDETLHGYTLASSSIAALLQPPLIFLTLHLVLLALCLLWLANGRFGTPPSPLRARRDGKAFLIANTASLLLVGCLELLQHVDQLEHFRISPNVHE